VSETARGFLLAGTLIGVRVPALLCWGFSGQTAVLARGRPPAADQSSVNFT